MHYLAVMKNVDYGPVMQGLRISFFQYIHGFFKVDFAGLMATFGVSALQRCCLA